MMLRVDLPAPVRTGGSVTIDVAWHFPVPVDGAGRMGRDGALYEIAQWYPRLAVYDDVHGWNTHAVHRCRRVLPRVRRLRRAAHRARRLRGRRHRHAREPGRGADRRAARAAGARARRATAPVAIITAEEAGNAARTRPATTGTLTWHFRADNVRDVAWAAAPNFRWDAVSWNGILIQTLYRPSATLWASEGIRMAEHAIRYFSQQWGTYPYPHATTVEGPISGMEYPMLTFVPAETTREGLYWVLMHEFGHEWFPMMVGSDERRYPVDGRGLQHLHRHLRLRRLLPRHPGHRHPVRPQPRGLPRQRDAGPGTAAQQRAVRGALPLLHGVPEAGADDVAAARRGPGPRRVRSRLPRVRAPLVVPAPAARRLLPHDGEPHRPQPRLVLAGLGVHDGAARSGGRLGARPRTAPRPRTHRRTDAQTHRRTDGPADLRAAVPARRRHQARERPRAHRADEPGADGDAGGAETRLRRRLERGAEAARRDLAPGQPARADGGHGGQAARRAGAGPAARDAGWSAAGENRWGR